MTADRASAAGLAPARVPGDRASAAGVALARVTGDRASAAGVAPARVPGDRASAAGVAPARVPAALKVALFHTCTVEYNEPATGRAAVRVLERNRVDVSVPAQRCCAGTLTSTRFRSSTRTDRKSTRLNSSHGYISYAVFCLKKKKTS